ncbi:MAG: pilus assembly protein PilP [Gammaproteobacteria bacterium]|nr:MAG: pilus assembly protein PilP [Gammaproteobacteria bacterium]
MTRHVKQIRSVKHIAKFISFAMLSVLLAGCGTGDMSDLTAYVDEVKSRKSGAIDPLPEIKPYETYTYQSSESRDPFEQTFIIEEHPGNEPAEGNGIRPNLDRRKEALEQFPLDSLRMVGILTQKDLTWAIIEAQDGSIHRLQEGNYLGQSHGRLISISEEKIEITEIVPNGRGGWEERPASIAMSEEEE